jgi:hypothetical protein
VSQLEKYNVSGERRNHLPGHAIASKEQQHFSLLSAILENRHVTLFHQVDMVSGIPPVGITQNDRFLSCDTVLLEVRYVLYVVFDFFSLSGEDLIFGLLEYNSVVGRWYWCFRGIC